MSKDQNKDTISRSFDPEVAKDVGTDEAIIYQNLVFWIAKNKANDKHFHDGKYWTYNSVKAFNELFYYLTPSKIRNCLKKLEDSGYIGVGNYNKSKYDRTKWYCVNEQIHLSKQTNGNNENDKPIPDIKPDVKPVDDEDEKKIPTTSPKPQPNLPKQPKSKLDHLKHLQIENEHGHTLGDIIAQTVGSEFLEAIINGKKTIDHFNAIVLSRGLKPIKDHVDEMGTNENNLIRLRSILMAKDDKIRAYLKDFYVYHKGNPKLYTRKDAMNHFVNYVSKKK